MDVRVPIGGALKGANVRGKGVRLCLLLGVTVFALAASGAAGARTGHATAGGTLVFAGAADPTYLDPALVSDGESFRVTEQIFEGLVSIKPGTTSIRPALATRWTLSKNGRTYTFFLRHGVKFHDGTRFNAAAVCANFNRWYNFSGPFQDASATYYYQAIFHGFRHNENSTLSPPLYRSCRAAGPYKAIVTLTGRNGPFLPALSLSAFAIQSPAAMRKYGANQGELRSGTFYPTGSYAFSHPTGTGPFRFQSWTVGQRVVLVKNKQYWGKKARLDRIIIQPIANNEARLQALKSGAVNGYDLVAPQDIGSIRGDSKLKTLDRPPFNVAYVTINQAHAPFDKLAVRQAVAYGLDRASVVRSFYFGRAVVAQEFLPPQIFGWTNKVPKYPYNPTKAKQLLQSAGLTLPVKVDFWYPTGVSRPYMPNPALNFQAFSDSLEKSGFRVVPHTAPWRPDYVKKVNDGTAGDLNLIGWTGDYGDPDNFVGVFFGTYSAQFGFHNNAIFNILKKAQQETNFKKRVALYKNANIMIMKYLPAVPYAHSKPALGFQRTVKGYVPNPTGTDFFFPVYFGGQ
jgi:peptide/nickel transport system substrate-binding protein